MTQEEFSGTGVLQSVYDDAIFAGVRPAEFQELTYGEIKACIRAYNRREEERAAEQIGRASCRERVYGLV